MIGADRFVDNLSPDSQKTHATQRYQRGYSEIDMWNGDTLIADVIVAVCDWHIAYGNTSPWHLEKSKWNDILQEIRDGFSARAEDGGVAYPPKSAWKLLSKHFCQLWD